MRAFTRASVETELPETRSDEYDKDYHREKNIEYHGLAMDDQGLLHTSSANATSTSIDSRPTPSIDGRRNDQSGRNGDGGGTRTTATVVDLETTATVVDPEATATVVDLEATATVVDLEETATVVDVEATATVWMWKQRLRWW
ncbi:hypothetical protein Bca4012_089361 [Brassica carinata]